MYSIKRVTLTIGVVVSVFLVGQQEWAGSGQAKQTPNDLSSASASASDWQIQMRQQGVKRARIWVEVRWQSSVSKTKVLRTVFYSEYDTNCSEIQEKERLAQIRASGLEKALSDHAILESTMSKVVCSEDCADAQRFVGKVDVFDYSPLVRAPVIFGALPSDDTFALLGDQGGVEQWLASPEATQATRRMALLGAVELTDDSCLVQRLIGAGAGIDARGGTGNTPLMNAASNGYLNDMRALLLSGAKVNDQDIGGETALMMAAHGGFLQAVKMLLDAGAEPSMTSKSGDTALSLAIRYHHSDVADLIKPVQVRRRQFQ